MGVLAWITAAVISLSPLIMSSGEPVAHSAVSGGSLLDTTSGDVDTDPKDLASTGFYLL